MKKRTSAFALIFIAFFISLALSAPQTTSASIISSSVYAPIKTDDYPVWISAPSIKLDSPIQPVGTNSRGEMAVPSGKTRNVGWYAEGARPGERGTAVLDAHVFAAFKNLRYIEPGQSIFISMASGAQYRFIVTKARNYSITELAPYTLFGASASPLVNLITCAGSLTSDRSTYDHRLVVTAELAS